jgi:hypothetical protein
MIAYTAWDSLRAIAREYDADLSLDAEARVALRPYWDRIVRSAPVRGLNDWSRRRLTTL